MIVAGILTLMASYGALGVLFALAFVTVGVGRVDPAARGATRGFRLLIFPGVVALWPLLAWRWLRRTGPPEERSPHRNAQGHDR
jgi:membrane protein implicated in regulation of membrane protease activity